MSPFPLLFPRADLICVIQAITCKEPQSLVTWSNHLGGAALLLSAQNMNASNNQTGLKVFLQLRYQIVNLNTIHDFVAKANFRLAYQLSPERYSSSSTSIPMVCKIQKCHGFG